VGLKWQDYVDIDPRYYRPAEVDLLIGDPAKAEKKLGWKPRTKFKALIELMVESDVRLLKDQLSGKPILSY
jgi:GDPmannose 4,6-dehydratase